MNLLKHQIYEFYLIIIHHFSETRKQKSFMKENKTVKNTKKLFLNTLL